MPPAVALFNYISSGLLWRIFFPNWDFRGVFFTYSIINLAVRNSAAMMAGDIILLECRTAYKGAMDGARGGKYYISKPLWSSGKIYASGSPSLGQKKKRTNWFLEISRGFLLGRSVAQIGCSIAQKDAV